ncbi:hypothetical protein Q7A53_05780 [Halobacillus rhizosphaerae]|uniref:hypothetical protein n=1 Tax=Halobacillus rhizosphaerae TaxID=3064889 RepID=UPI00398B8CB3
MKDKECKVFNCKNKHEALGYCERHYKSYIRHGNPLQVDKNLKKRENRKDIQRATKNKRFSTNGVCLIDGCDEPRKSRGLCEKHYARWRRNGTTDSTGRRYSHIKTCLRIDCNRPAKTAGLCDTHAGYYYQYGSPYLPKVIKKCGIEWCDKPHQAKGLCMDHYRQWKKILLENERN